jgi:hypothetical protein
MILRKGEYTSFTKCTSSLATDSAEGRSAAGAERQRVEACVFPCFGTLMCDLGFTYQFWAKNFRGSGPKTSRQWILVFSD